MDFGEKKPPAHPMAKTPLSEKYPRFPVLRWAEFSAGIALIVIVGVVVWRNCVTRFAAPATSTVRSDRVHPSGGQFGWAESASVAAPTATAGSAQAVVQCGGRRWRSSPNARGEFARLYLPPSAQIVASVTFPAGKPGDVILVQAEDGGALQIESGRGSVMLDGAKQAHVAFQAGANDGLYRVTMRRGAVTRVLEFWVGTQPPVLVRR